MTAPKGKTPCLTKGLLWPLRYREEWIGDLHEARHKWIEAGYSPSVVELMTAGRAFHLYISLVQIKIFELAWQYQCHTKDHAYGDWVQDMRSMTETITHNDLKDRVVADFNAMADTYDTLRLVQVAARRLVDLVPLPAGAQVLDVATGTGWTALAAAQHVGPTGTVVGIDLAPDLLVCARQKRAAAGLTNVELRPGDAERLDFADQRFDVVLCTMALFFVPDMLAALREWWRVLKPGGQVSFSAWGPTYRQPLQGLWNARLDQYGVPLPAASPNLGPHNLRLADLETCRRLLHEAGFVQIEVQREHEAYAFRTAEEWWAEMWTSRSRLAVLQLPPAQRAQFQAEHLAEVAALATAHGIEVDVAINIARGWKRAA